MSNEILLRHEDGATVTLTLNDPGQYNVLSEAMLGELEGAIADIAARDDLKVLVIAANGKAFCAGHNLKEMRATPERAYYEALFTRCSRFMQSLVALPIPVIARVQGIATAAGCQLVATCDMAVAAEDARFAVSGVNLGLFCSTPSVALSRVMNPKRAFEMLSTGEFINAATAQEWGLINRAVPADDLDTEIARLTGSIARKSPVPLKMGKALFYRQIGQSLPAAYADAGTTMAANMMTADAVEGIDAFIEKRDPEWTGR